MNSYLHFFLTHPILWTPVVSLLTFLCCLIARTVLLNKQKTAPEGVNETTLERLRVCVRVFGIITAVTVVLIVGAIILRSAMVAHM